MTIGETITVAELEADPYPAYERLRAEEPVSFVPAVGLWLVTRWDDVLEVDKTPEVFTAETDPSTLNRTFGYNLLGSDGAYHQRIRSIIEPAFRARTVRDTYVEAVIRPLVVDLLDGLAPHGEAEVMSTFAELVSIRTLQHVLGLGELDESTLHRWFEGLGTGAANFEGDPDKQAIADEVSAEVDTTLDGILDRLATDPDDTILSRMLHTEVDGERLTRAEISANVKVMIVGGMQEPGDAIGIALWALLSHPDQLEALRSDPARLPDGLEEVFRWHSPVGTSTRQTTRPVTLGGVDLETGALVAAVLASANRDDRHWTDPDQLDVHRDEGAHLGFAIGHHFCVGAHLARYEARIAFEELLARLPGLRLDDDRPIELNGWEFRRPLHLHVAWNT
jgi:cytochrome P450